MYKLKRATLPFLLIIAMVSLPFVSAQTSPIIGMCFVKYTGTSLAAISETVVPSPNYDTIPMGIAVTLRIPEGSELAPDDWIRSSNHDLTRVMNMATVNQDDGTIVRRFTIYVNVNAQDTFPLELDLTYECNIRPIGHHISDHYSSVIILDIQPPATTPLPTETVAPAPDVTPIIHPQDSPTDTVNPVVPSSTGSININDLLLFSSPAITVAVILLIVILVVVVSVVIIKRRKSPPQEFLPPPPPPPP